APSGEVYTLQATVGSVAVERWSASGTLLDESALIAPTSLDVDTHGRVYITDYAADEVVRFTEDLDVDGGWDLPASPEGIAVDADDRAYVTAGSRVVDVFTAGGKRLARVKAAKSAELTSIDVTDAGRIYAIDQHGSDYRVVVLHASSTPKAAKKVDANAKRTK